MFVLSYVLPPTGGAKYGKAVVNEPQPEAEVFDQVSTIMTEHFSTMPAINLPGSLAYLIANTPTSTDIYDPVTGFTFRLDPEDRAPNVCPCCGRLVKFGDHAYAGSDDAYCLGCYTWDRNSDPCLPENTTHTTTED